MKVYTNTTDFDANWNDVSYAIFNKYPNPFSSHVIQSDVLQRQVNSNGTLSSLRLHVKTGTAIPKWAYSIFNKNKHPSQSYILEESTVDTDSQRMVTQTRNLDHRKYLYVQETQQVFPCPLDPKNKTRVVVTAQINSQFGMQFVQSQVEKFGHSKFSDNLKRSMQGLCFVIDSIRARIPTRKTSSSNGDGSHF